MTDLIAKARRISEIGASWHEDAAAPFILENAHHIAEALLRCVETLEWYGQIGNYLSRGELVEISGDLDLGQRARNVLENWPVAPDEVGRLQKQLQGQENDNADAWVEIRALRAENQALRRKLDNAFDADPYIFGKKDW